MATSTAPGRRLSRVARRDQLLDAAADVVVASGPGAVTMERVADHAGVSKALPYQHFANATELLRALHEREVAHLGRRVLVAVRGARGADAQWRAAIDAYFDVIAERGVLLGVLGRAVPAGDAEPGPPVGQRFVASLLTEVSGVTGQRALVLAEVVQAALLGAVTAWGRGDASRRLVQTTVTDALLAMIGSVTARR